MIAGPALREMVTTSGNSRQYNRRSIRGYGCPHGPTFPGATDQPVRGIGVRQVRLVSGMILFAYLVSHFLNHALGNFSLDALAEGVWLAYAVLAIPPGGHRVLRRLYRACRAWYLGAVSAPPIPLEDDGAAAARPRPDHSDPGHRPYNRRPACARRCTVTRSSIRRCCSPISFRGPHGGYGAWLPRSWHRLDPWLHRTAFLAADEAVLQARRAIPVCGGRAAARACHARRLSGRARASPTMTASNGGPKTFPSSKIGTKEQHDTIDHRRRIFADLLSRAGRARVAGKGRARAA